MTDADGVKRLHRLLAYLDQTPENPALLTDIAREALTDGEYPTVLMATDRLRVMGVAHPRVSGLEIHAKACMGLGAEVLALSNDAKDRWLDDEALAQDSAWALYLVRMYEESLERIAGINWSIEEYSLRAAEMAVQCLWQLGRHAEALNVCEGALRRWPQSPRLLACASGLLFDQDRLDDACTLAWSAASTGATSLIQEALPVLAMQALRDGDLPGARAWTDRALDHRDDDVRACLVRAVVLLEQHAWKEAEDALHRVLSLEPEHPEAQLMLGWVLCGQQQWREAEVLVHHALRCDPTWTDAHALQSIILNAHGDHEASQQALQRARRLQADNPSVICATAVVSGEPDAILAAMAIGRSA